VIVEGKVIKNNKNLFEDSIKRLRKVVFDERKKL
jgi:preprotein translocase subunit SecE